MAKMKKANVPVGYLRTVEQGFNAPEVRDRHRLSQIPHPTAGSVPNIESPLNMSLHAAIDPVAAPLLGQHTKEVLRKTLGYDDRRIAALAEAGAFGKTAIPADRPSDRLAGLVNIDVTGPGLIHSDRSRHCTYSAITVDAPNRAVSALQFGLPRGCFLA